MFTLKVNTLTPRHSAVKPELIDSGYTEIITVERSRMLDQSKTTCYS